MEGIVKTVALSFLLTQSLVDGTFSYLFRLVL